MWSQGSVFFITHGVREVSRSNPSHNQSLHSLHTKEQIRQFRRSITDRFKPSVSQYFPSYKTAPCNQVLNNAWDILRKQFGVARKLTNYVNLAVFERQI